MNFIKVLSTFLFLFMFNGCFSEDKSLKVAISPWIGYEAIYQAEAFGWLDKGIELVKGETPSDNFKRIMSGEVDAAALTMEDVLVARSQGVNLTIVAVLDVSAGADIILSKDEISDLSHLKGKRVGAEISALSSLMLTKTLEKGGLRYDDVTVLDLSPTKQLEAWKAGKIDFVVSFEPYASQLLAEGAHYLIAHASFRK